MDFYFCQQKGKGLDILFILINYRTLLLDLSFSKNEGLFNVLGPEELTYKEMCLRIFEWYSFYPLVIIIPKTLRRIFIILSKVYFEKTIY